MEVTFRAGDDGVSNLFNTFMVRADTFYSTIVGAAGGEMVFLGGHGAFGGTFSAYHMHIAMFISGGDFWDDRAFANNERWGLRYAFISGTMGFPMRTVGAINNDSYLVRANRSFFNHLYSGTGMVQQLFSGHNHFMDNHRRTFAYSGLWTNSTSYTIGLVRSMGLSHGMSPAQIASSRGINNAFAPRYFGRLGRKGM